MSHLSREYIESIVAGVVEASRKLAACEKELRASCSFHDKRINDLLHQIELEPPKSASEGYTFYKDLRESLETRRAAKDAYDYYSHCRKIINTCTGKTNRTYTKRSENV